MADALCAGKVQALTDIEAFHTDNNVCYCAMIAPELESEYNLLQRQLDERESKLDCYNSIRLHYMQIRWTASFPFLLFPTIEAHVRYRSHRHLLYNNIWCLTHVRYNLLPVLCQFDVQYDLATFCCTISISKPPLLQYLVLGELRSLST